MDDDQEREFEECVDEVLKEAEECLLDPAGEKDVKKCKKVSKRP